MPENRSAEISLLISREHAENKFREAVRLFVGKGKLYSAAQLAKGIGLKDKTKPLYDFLSYPSGHPDYRPPNFGLMLSITAFLGPDFTNEWLVLTNQGAFDLPDDAMNLRRLAADNSDDNATVVRAAVDGQFDDDERSDLKVVGSRMMTRGAQLVAISAQNRRRAA